MRWAPPLFHTVTVLSVYNVEGHAPLWFPGLWVVTVLVLGKGKRTNVTVEYFQHLIKINILRMTLLLWLSWWRLLKAGFLTLVVCCCGTLTCCLCSMMGVSSTAHTAWMWPSQLTGLLQLGSALKSQPFSLLQCIWLRYLLSVDAVLSGHFFSHVSLQVDSFQSDSWLYLSWESFSSILMLVL